MWNQGRWTGPRPHRPPGGHGPIGYVQSAEYLRDGYLDEMGNPRPELVTSEADRVADEFYKSRLKYSQLRRFFTKARFIEQQLDSGQGFQGQLWRLMALDRDAADAVGRDVAPQALKVFMEKNLRLARKDETHFRKGFMQHFESVMAYFRYRRPQE